MRLRWRKRGLIFEPARHGLPPGCIGWAQSPQALRLQDRVRVFFSTRVPDTPTTFLSHVAFADFSPDFSEVLSVQGPVIALGGLGEFDEHGIFPLSVVRTARGLYGYSTGWSRRRAVSVETAIGLAVSHDDGRSFTKVGTGPVLGPSLFEPFLVGDAFVREFRGQFHMWYIFGTAWAAQQTGGMRERTYKIAHATSPDGHVWVKSADGVQIIADRLGPSESQALPSVIEHGGAFLMVFCYRETFGFREGGGRGYRLGAARSDDLVHWERRDVDVPQLGKPGEWDSEMMCYPNLFADEGRLHLLYNGNAFGREGFGLATLEP